MIEALPWACVSVLLAAVLGLWGYTSSTRRDVENVRKELDEFRLKVAEQYTTNTSLERSMKTLVDAINELKVELKETRKEYHNDRRNRSNA